MVSICAFSSCTKSTAPTANPISADDTIYGMSMTDVEGNSYHTIKIGTQIWTAENLRTTKYNDGTPIDTNWQQAIGAYCFAPWYAVMRPVKGDAADAAAFGCLYNLFAINTNKLAPIGWHIPSDSEWSVMVNYLVLNGYNCDGSTDTSAPNTLAKALADKYTWRAGSFFGCSIDSGSTTASEMKNNRSGFTATCSQWRSLQGTIEYGNTFGDYCTIWWTTTMQNGLQKCRQLNIGSDSLMTFTFTPISDLWSTTYPGTNGYSIRLIKD